MVTEVRKSEARASRIRALLKLRDKAEADIAAELRAHLDEVGEARWLWWAEKEFGWKRTAAYNHLHPERLAKDREEAKHRRVSDGPTPGSRGEAEDVADREAEAEAQREVDEITEKERQEQQKRYEEWGRNNEEWDARERRQKERLALALELLKLGHREYARKHHPDHGGDGAKMAAANAARDWAIGFLENPPSMFDQLLGRN